MISQEKALNVFLDGPGQDNPAEFAYRAAVNEIKMRDIGDLSTFEDRIRADAAQKAVEEYKKSLDAKSRAHSNLPTPLSDNRASGGNSNPPIGEETLDDVVGSDASHR